MVITIILLIFFWSYNIETIVLTGLFFTHSQPCSLVKERRFCYATTSFLKMTSEKQAQKFHNYTDHVSLPKSCFSASDWLKKCFNQSEALLTCHHCGISALVFQTSFAVKPVMASCNIGSFLRLSNMLSCCEHRCVTS